MKTAAKDLVNSIQEIRNEIYMHEDNLGYYESKNDEATAEKIRKEISQLNESLENLMNQLGEMTDIKGSLPQKISIDGRHMFLDSEETENGFAFFYQSSDSFSPDIYVCNENQQLAGKDMEYELKSRGIEW